MREFSATTKKAIKAFKNGRKLTSTKLRDMGVANPSAMVWSLRYKHDMNIQHDGKYYYL